MLMQCSYNANSWDAGHVSLPRPQAFGISQGCPLSPFLFVMVMTVLIHDAKAKLQDSDCFTATGRLCVQELLYADDTLLVDTDVGVVQTYMDCINDAGAQYGLAFNWTKLEVLPVRCAALLHTPDGSYVRQKETMKYLGSTLSADGSVATEINARLGAARADFQKLSRVWANASITQRKKLEIFNACVVSKLLYCLQVACLHTAEFRKLDAFYVRCLRSIAGIKHSYYSRVSNQAVLETMRCLPLSVILRRRQLLYIADIARKPASHPLRDSVFEPGTYKLKSFEGSRKRGRPRATWAEQVWSTAVQISGNEDSLAALWADTPAARKAWASIVSSYL